jgi:hypothetical protein
MNDGSGDPAATPPPGPEPTTWQSTDGPVAAGGPPPAVSGWVVPDTGSGRRRSPTWVVVAAIVAVVAAVALIGTTFLGRQVGTLLAGTVEYGSDGIGCFVTGNATTFARSVTVHYAAHLTRVVPAGTNVTQTTTLPDGTTESQDQAFDTTSRCLFGDVGPNLSPGRYVLEFRAGTETLSKGTFDITP